MDFIKIKNHENCSPRNCEGTTIAWNMLYLFTKKWNFMLTDFVSKSIEPWLQVLKDKTQSPPPPPFHPIPCRLGLFKINLLFSIKFKIFYMGHVMYMALKEFLSKKRQLPRWSKSDLDWGGGVLTWSTFDLT